MLGHKNSGIIYGLNLFPNKTNPQSMNPTAEPFCQKNRIEVNYHNYIIYRIA